LSSLPNKLFFFTSVQAAGQISLAVLFTSKSVCWVGIQNIERTLYADRSVSTPEASTSVPSALMGFPDAAVRTEQKSGAVQIPTTKKP
jgi:hypothetical protein